VDGTVQCWGDDVLGQASPPATGNFVEVSAGAEHTCALQATGDVSCWGANTHGESTPTPGTYIWITSGKDFSCGFVRLSNNVVNCWGNVPPSWTISSQFAAGDAHVCQLSSPVTCFGDNSQGQSSPPPNSRMGAIAAGSAHTCGILNGVGGGTRGKILCWGDNSDSQSTPPDGTFIDIAAGDHHTCALSETGLISCWGKNDRGQASAPSGQFLALDANGSLSCGVSVSGNTVCWGDSAFGRLAAPPPPTFRELSLGGLTNARGTAIVCGIRSDDTRFCSSGTPKHVTLPATNLRGFAIGDNYGEPSICALRPDKTAVCWGDAPTGIFITDPEAILRPPPDQFDFVAVGSWHACGVRPNRTVVCWGNNYYGQTDVPPDIAGP
jgi:alpha-tubulin suppressor-like RCC1 family protein